MTKNVKKLTLLLAAVSLVSIVCATRAEADYTISIDAGANGFHMVYRLPLIATGWVNLKEGDKAKPINLSFLFIPIAKLELSVVSSDTTITETHPLPTLKLHYIVTGASFTTMESDIDVPWCTAGIEIGLFKAFGLPPLGDKDIKAYFMLKKEKSHVEVSINTATIADQSWKDDATPDNPTITKEVDFTQDGQTIPFTVELTFDSSSALMTQVTYSIPMPGSALIAGGPLTLPNGRYSLWINYYKGK